MLQEVDLLPYQIQRMQEVEGNLRKQPYTDPAIQLLSEKFLRAAFLMDTREQDACTRHFVEDVAGVEVPNPWHSDYQWLDQMGKRLNGGETTASHDGVSFWKNVRRSVPEFLTPAELEILQQQDSTGGGGLHLISYFSWYGTSPIAGQVDTHIHAWK